jgi:hypothetical protein
MASHKHDSKMPDDKQLRGIRLADVLEKRRLDQALNAKEFAVCAGVSYSTARGWFHLPGFPAFRGIVFWQDFVQWRTGRNNLKSQGEQISQTNDKKAGSNLPPRAEQILRAA